MRKIILRAAMVICAAALLFSGWKLLSIWLEYRQGTAAYDDAATQYTYTVQNDTESAAQTPESGSDSADSSEETAVVPAPECAPIAVDFDALRRENADVIGWIYCEGTPINYPVLQAADNDWYLHRMLSGESNSAGSIFADYRNAPDFSDCNTLIYGHNMKNNTMFGTLPDFQTRSFYEDHPVLWLLTPEQNWKIVVLGGSVVDDDDDIYDALFDEENVRSQVERILARSTVDAPACDWTQVVTLSTCSYEYEDARFILIGALEPVQ